MTGIWFTKTVKLPEFEVVNVPFTPKNTFLNKQLDTLYTWIMHS